MLKLRFCSDFPTLFRSFVLYLSTLSYINTEKFDRVLQNDKLRLEQQTAIFVGERIIANYLSHCSILMVTNAGWRHDQSTFPSDVRSSLLRIINSNSYTATSLVSPSNLPQDAKTTLTKLGSSCKFVITVLSQVSHELFQFFEQLTSSKSPELTRRDEDYFVFITSSEEVSRSLLHSATALLMRYKIVIYPNTIFNPFHKSQTIVNNSASRAISFSINTLCIYCPNSMNRIIPVPIPDAHASTTVTRSLSLLFPDTTRDLYQHTVRVSGPTKYLGTYEMEMLNGKYRHKRGIHTLIFNTVAGKINMSYSLQPCTRFGSIPEGASGVLLKNGTWAGCMGDVVRGISDMALSVSPDDHRFHYVHFTKAMEYTYVTYTTAKPGLFYSWKSVFTALEVTVWGFVIASMLVAPITIHLTDRHLGLHEHLSSKASFYKLFETGLYLLGYVVGQDICSPHASLSKSSKFVYVAWLFYGLLIGAVYSCSLQAVIVSPRLDFVPMTFSELVNSNYEWGAASSFRNGLGEQLFKNSDNPVMRRIYQTMEGDTDEVACTRKALSRYACFNWEIMQRFHLQTEFADKSGNHPFQSARDTAFFTSLNFITRKRELFRSQFNEFISRSFDSGLVKQTVARDWRKFRLGVVKARREGKLVDLSPPQTMDGPKAFRFDNVKGGFIVLLCGVVISVASFLLEKVINFNFEYNDIKLFRALKFWNPEF